MKYYYCLEPYILNPLTTIIIIFLTLLVSIAMLSTMIFIYISSEKRSRIASFVNNDMGALIGEDHFKYKYICFLVVDKAMKQIFIHSYYPQEHSVVRDYPDDLEFKQTIKAFRSIIGKKRIKYVKSIEQHKKDYMI